uniref:Dolichol phosphate-mannose biosynthesis regulatory protein n=1 Tax=Plectus sambesii TaxID=2011161 RepID=A0A914VRK6_9BILA
MFESLVVRETIPALFLVAVHPLAFYHRPTPCTTLAEQLPNTVIEMSDFLELLTVYVLLAVIAFLLVYYGSWFIVLRLAQPNSLLLHLFPRKENASTVFLAACVACIGVIGILVGISLCGETLRTRSARLETMKAQERQRHREPDSDAEEIITGKGTVSIEQKKVQ